MANYTVQGGDCISSIAWQFGFFPDTLWNHPGNAALKSKRKDPNVLLPGDTVFVPDKRPREEDAATNKTHTFKAKGVPAVFKLCLLRDGKPRANEKYVLNIDGKLFEGSTDGGGNLEHAILPDAKEGKLTLSDGQEEYELKLGHLDPIDEVRGIQARLRSLGFYSGDLGDEMNAATRGALAAFQKSKGLSSTGAPDQATKEALKSAFGS